MYVVSMQVPMESGRGLSDPPELEFLVGVSSLMWVLGTEFGSSRGAARVAAELPLQLQAAVLNEDTNNKMREVVGAVGWIAVGLAAQLNRFIPPCPVSSSQPPEC